MTSALVYHELSDAIPFGTDIALPRGTRHPAGFAHVTWHSFDPATFIVGRENLEIAPGLEVAMYPANRTIVFRFLLCVTGALGASNRCVGALASSPGPQTPIVPTRILRAGFAPL